MHVGPGECMQRSRGTIFIIKPRNVEMSNILLDYGWLVGAHIKKVMYQVSEEVFCSIICIHSCIFFFTCTGVDSRAQALYPAEVSK